MRGSAASCSGPASSRLRLCYAVYRPLSPSGPSLPQQSKFKWMRKWGNSMSWSWAKRWFTSNRSSRSHLLPRSRKSAFSKLPTLLAVIRIANPKLYVYMKKPNHPYFHCTWSLNIWGNQSMDYYYGCLSDARGYFACPWNCKSVKVKSVLSIFVI